MKIINVKKKNNLYSMTQNNTVLKKKMKIQNFMKQTSYSFDVTNPSTKRSKFGGLAT